MKRPGDAPLRSDDSWLPKGPQPEVVSAETAPPLVSVERATELEALSGIALRERLLKEASHGTLPDLVEKVGLERLLEVCRARGFNANDVLAATASVTTRGLTTREAARIRENFGGTLDPDSIRFHFTRGATTMGASALVVGNVIQIDPSDSRWSLRAGTTLAADPEDDGWNSFNSVLLAHEPTHVWSYQHQGSNYALNSVNDQLAAMSSSGSRFDAYTYRPNRPSFWAYGEEQRAMIMQDYVTAFFAERRRAKTVVCLYGGLLPPSEVLATLMPFIRQMRSAGPGQSTQTMAQPAERVFCSSPPPGFAQDGALDALAHQADAVVAGVGEASTHAFVEGLERKNAAQLALGSAGIATAVAASVVSREQNAAGASSGGSAILDQAHIPHGVSLDDGTFSGSAKVSWAAPAPHLGAPTVGFKNARLDTEVGLHGPVSPSVEVAGSMGTTIGLEGSLKEVRASASVETSDLSAQVHAEVSPETRDSPLAVTAGLELESPAASLVAEGQVEAQHGQVNAIDASARLDASHLAAGASTRFERASADAPLAMTRTSLDVALMPSDAVAVGASATVVPAGLDALSVGVSGQRDGGTVALSGYGRDLTTRPRVGVEVAATNKQGVSITGSADTTVDGAETTVGIGLKVPL